MRRYLTQFFFRGYLALMFLAFASAVAQSEAVDVFVFWGDGCPHCEVQKPFLQELDERPGVNVYAYEVWYQPQNRPLFQEMAAAYGIQAGGVPTTFIGGRVWVGFSDVYRQDMLQTVIDCSHYGCPSPATLISEGADALRELPTESSAETGLSLPVLGEIDLRLQPLLVSTMLIAFVDGFNPCSLWVLTLLLALVIHSGSRKRIILVGITFLLVTAALYGVFISGLVTVLAYVGYLWWIQLLVALFAFSFALVNIKDYFWYKQGFSFTIADQHKPGIYRRLRQVLDKDKVGWRLVAATAVMAAGIALIELPCTAGFPVIWSNLVSGAGLPMTGYLSLLAVYLLVYLLDELLVFVAVAVSLKASRFEEKHGRVLKLIGGMIMLALALVIVFRPDMMNSIASLLLVFGAALAASLLIIILHRALQKAPS